MRIMTKASQDEDPVLPPSRRDPIRIVSTQPSRRDPPNHQPPTSMTNSPSNPSESTGVNEQSPHHGSDSHTTTTRTTFPSSSTAFSTEPSSLAPGPHVVMRPQEHHHPHMLPATFSENISIRSGTYHYPPTGFCRVPDRITLNDALRCQPSWRENHMNLFPGADANFTAFGHYPPPRSLANILDDAMELTDTVMLVYHRHLESLETMNDDDDDDVDSSQHDASPRPTTNPPPSDGVPPQYSPPPPRGRSEIRRHTGRNHRHGNSNNYYHKSDNSSPRQ